MCCRLSERSSQDANDARAGRVGDAAGRRRDIRALESGVWRFRSHVESVERKGLLGITSFLNEGLSQNSRNAR